MDPLEAEATAERLERRLGAIVDRVEVDCHPVPSRPGAMFHRVDWSFLIVTDAPRGLVRDALSDHTVEWQRWRGESSVLVAWPRV